MRWESSTAFGAIFPNWENCRGDNQRCLAHQPITPAVRYLVSGNAGYSKYFITTTWTLTLCKAQGVQGGPLPELGQYKKSIFDIS